MSSEGLTRGILESGLSAGPEEVSSCLVLWHGSCCCCSKHQMQFDELSGGLSGEN